MNTALVTGAAGFIGRRVVDRLARAGHKVLIFEAGDTRSTLEKLIVQAEFVFHCAGVNRPSDPADFAVNANLTEQICQFVETSGTGAPIILASSTQAELDNPYGASKRHAEMALEKFAERGGRAVIFRLPNVFGPGCRPNYNSVVATFAHNVAHGLPVEVHDPARELTLVYVHDVAQAMVEVIRTRVPAGVPMRPHVAPFSKITVGVLADALTRYHESRRNADAPAVSDDFERKLYATYLSYLEPDNFAYSLAKKTDNRGSLAEFLKSPCSGQLFISRTKPGQVRGQHYHYTKTEKFFVVEGDGIVRFRRVDGRGEILEYRVSGTEFRVVDIPPDYTHSIENVGTNEMVVLFWASEIFNPDSPDTYQLNV